jgi:acetyl esterase
MSLDTATTSFLEAMRAGGGRPLHEQTLDEVRAGIAAASQQLAAPPAEVHEVAGRAIPVPGGEIGIRIYTPRPVPAGTTLPMVLHFHGGGFIAGSLDTHDSIARYLARHADAIVIGVGYRLSPEHRFPAAVDDAYAAVSWATAHARGLNGDAGRIAVTGDSAGGNLSAVVCQLAKERGGPRIAFQALIYPAVDLDSRTHFPSRSEFGGGAHFLSTRDMAWFASLYLTDVERQVGDPKVSPLAARDLQGLPPALVVTSGCDPLRDEGKAYADRLAAAGVPVEYHCVEGTIHACMSFAGAIPAGLEMLTLVASRLQAALH